jgi:multiple sugar transport system ATP-binding protein
MASISIESVSKSFGGTAVLRDTTLDIADGEFVTLLGPSGCGKSTLLRLIAGLETSDAGRVKIGDIDVTALPPKSRDVAMVFQSYALYPHLSVFDNIAVPLRMRRLSALQRFPLIGRFVPGAREVSGAIAEDVHRTAAVLDISPLLGRKPGQLSGGQRQRVAVGRAMVRNPAAFLMDEPLSNLDAKLRVHMRTEIAQLHRSLATTFVYVTHDQSEAMTMSDRVAVMLGGRLLQVGTPDAIYHEPITVEVAEFIGSPRINLVDGIYDGWAARCDAGALSLALALQAGQPVRIGFRCESATLTDVDRGHLSGEVTHIENLGSDHLVHVRCEGNAAPIVVRTGAGGRRAQRGDRVGINAGPRLLAFTPGGERIAQAPAHAGCPTALDLKTAFARA